MKTPFNPQLTPLKTLFKKTFRISVFLGRFIKKPFRRSHILGTQNVKVKHPTAPKH
ncbi:hypothetical protein FNE39_00430 [Helicobacter pylori]|nr:hypothetical protein FNE39_00430 [Helicobacter pylori]